jgi:hypothetical protein
MRSSPEMTELSRDAGRVGSTVSTGAPELASPDPYATVRRALVAGAGLLIVGALYLIAVRGSAILADLSALGARVWCF